MSQEEKAETLYIKTLENLKHHKKIIEEHLSRQKNKLELVAAINTWEQLEEASLDSPPFQLTEKGVKVCLIGEEVYEILKDIIPTTINELTLPHEILPSIEELARFPNLKKLIDIEEMRKYTPEELEAFQKTSITECICPNAQHLLSEDSFAKGTIWITAVEEELIKQGKTIIRKSEQPAQKLTNVKIILEQFKDFPTLVDLMETEHIIFRLNKENHFHNRLMIQSNRKYGQDYISEKQGSVILELEDSKVKAATIATDDIEDIIAIATGLTKWQSTLKSVNLKLENKTYQELETIDENIKSLPLKIKYGTDDCSYDEFMLMRATIDWYKKIIMEQNLSPAEKTCFAYDIVKSFPYNESMEDQMNSRQIPKVIKTGNIVCVGYAKLLTQLLNELGVKAEMFTAGFHARNIIHLDDDKYNIHGVYTIDATWDSGEMKKLKTEEGDIKLAASIKSTDTIIKEYDALSLYNDFLIPYSDYERKYSTADFPKLYEATRKNDFNIINNELLEVEKNTLFDNDVSDEEIKQIVENTKKPSLETFISLLRTVREKEGYHQETENSLNNTLEINQMLDHYSNDETFFKPRSK